MATINGLYLTAIEEDWHLTELENNLIAQLPRTPIEAGLIPVKLKRKMEYDGSHKTELINHQKIFKTLGLLKKSGNPYY